VEKPDIFKNKPLKRLENDLMLYKEIFIDPKETKLKTI
jgi:hypothetical protein